MLVSYLAVYLGMTTKQTTTRRTEFQVIPMTGDSHMFTVSCLDAMFAGRTNDGSYATIDEAIEGAEQSKRRCPKSRTRFQIHVNPRGYGYVDSPVVLSLIL
jgi:hypothetical protein